MKNARIKIQGILWIVIMLVLLFFLVKNGFSPDAVIADIKSFF